MKYKIGDIVNYKKLHLGADVTSMGNVLDYIVTDIHPTIGGYCKIRDIRNEVNWKWASEFQLDLNIEAMRNLNIDKLLNT